MVSFWRFFATLVLRFVLKVCTSWDLLDTCKSFFFFFFPVLVHWNLNWCNVCQCNFSLSSGSTGSPRTPMDLCFVWPSHPLNSFPFLMLVVRSVVAWLLPTFLGSAVYPWLKMLLLFPLSHRSPLKIDMWSPLTVVVVVVVVLLTWNTFCVHTLQTATPNQHGSQTVRCGFSA